MKIKSALLLAVALFAVSGVSARANSVTNTIISPPNSGDLVNSAVADEDFTSILQGKLAANSILTVTYTVAWPASDLNTNSIKGTGSYKYTDAGTTFQGSASNYVDSDGNVVGKISAATPGGSENLVVTQANLSGAGSVIGTAVIKNLSDGIVAFKTIWQSTFADFSGDVLIHYSIASVPLPAALPLFGLGIAGLLGFGARRKKDAA